MRAMMSSAPVRPSYEAMPENQAYLGVVALREAERILGETEREEVHSFGHAAFHVSLNMLSMYLLDGEDDANSLAESLAAVLPVLDELAAAATSDAVCAAWGPSLYTTPLDEPVPALWREAIYMRDRNRATNAALDAQAGR